MAHELEFPSIKKRKNTILDLEIPLQCFLCDEISFSGECFLVSLLRPGVSPPAFNLRESAGLTVPLLNLKE